MLKTIALFQFPEAFGIPGHSVQLHVFEQRFKNLVKSCLQDRHWVGVCPSNLQANGVFGAGPMTILQELEDGRFRIEVKIKDRFTVVKKLQDIPFALVQCKAVIDEELSPDLNASLRKELNAICHKLIIDQPALLRKYVSSEESENEQKSFTGDLYRVLKWIALPSEDLQQIIECRSPETKMHLFREALTPKKLFAQRAEKIETKSGEGTLLRFTRSFKKAKGVCLSTQ
jgi:Lon protease-like protein